jgi:HK97 family phage major capsid protein
MWLKSINGDSHARQWVRDALGIESRDLGGQVNSLGGALVFEDFSNSLIRLAETFGVSMNLAQRVTTSSDTLLVPKRLSGVTSYWLGENSTITTSDPTATMVQLVLQKIAAATRVSNELLADNAISVAQWLVQEYATSLSGAIDDAFFNGTGTSAYGGIRGLSQIDDGTHTASVVSAASGNTSLAALDIDDYLKALAALPRYAIGTSAWYMHPSVYHQSVQRMMLSSGTAGSGTIGRSPSKPAARPSSAFTTAARATAAPRAAAGLGAPGMLPGGILLPDASAGPRRLAALPRARRLAPLGHKGRRAQLCERALHGL